MERAVRHESVPVQARAERRVVESLLGVTLVTLADHRPAVRPAACQTYSSVMPRKMPFGNPAK